MKNKHFPDEDIAENDIFFMCYMIERVARKTMMPDETEVAALIRVYNHPICELIDNYNGSMYYEPSDWLASEYKRAS